MCLGSSLFLWAGLGGKILPGKISRAAGREKQEDRVAHPVPGEQEDTGGEGLAVKCCILTCAHCRDEWPFQGSPNSAASFLTLYMNRGHAACFALW